MKLKQLKKNYNPYFDIYLNDLKIDEDCFDRLKNNHTSIYEFFENIEKEKFKYSYSSTKWTVAQILQHIIDTERIFGYRALKIVREKEPDIESYNHENYAKTYNYQSKDILLEDYSNNRKASISLFKSFTNTDLKKSIDVGHYKFNVGLIPFIFCGHELHHVKIIKDKYLN